MAFKSLAQYQEDKNGDFFVLPNDGDYADVIFLYTSVNDVLVADVHYIQSASYKGYAHCCGTGCPACSYGERGIRLDHKIFIPLYNIQKNKVEFWDRTTFFEQVLQKSVFGPFPNPSEAVFRIIRHGEAGSRDTRYEIKPVGRNSRMPYEQICADMNISFPDGYSRICKDMPASEMYAALNSTAAASDIPDYGYVPVPRGTAAAPVSDYVAPSVTVPTPEYSAPPEVAPPLVDTASELVPPASEGESELAPWEDVKGSEGEASSSDIDDVDF